MFIPAAIMVLAVYTPGGDTHNPIDGLDTSSSYQQQESNQARTARDASPGSQTTSTGEV